MVLISRLCSNEIEEQIINSALTEVDHLSNLLALWCTGSHMKKKSQAESHRVRAPQDFPRIIRNYSAVSIVSNNIEDAR